MTNIQWTDATWNPVTGCRKVSPGCAHCYAETMARRQMGQWKGRAFEDVRVHPERLDAPLHWRKPRRVFVNSMSDLFHEDVPDEFIDQVFAVMALAPRHTFQILTKRPERMRAYLSGILRAAGEIWPRRVWSAMHAIATPRHQWRATGWPLPNVWLGVSCEDQQRADERVPILLDTPAAVRFVSAEPLLSCIDFRYRGAGALLVDGSGQRMEPQPIAPLQVDWIIVGGESGSGARPCDMEWIRDIVRQCREADVPCFVKQLGAKPYDGLLTRSREDWTTDPRLLRLMDRKGGDQAEWPADLRVREWPASTASAASSS